MGMPWIGNYNEIVKTLVPGLEMDSNANFGIIAIAICMVIIAVVAAVCLRWGE